MEKKYVIKVKANSQMNQPNDLYVRGVMANTATTNFPILHRTSKLEDAFFLPSEAVAVLFKRVVQLTLPIGVDDSIVTVVPIERATWREVRNAERMIPLREVKMAWLAAAEVDAGGLIDEDAQINGGDLVEEIGALLKLYGESL